MCCDVSGYDPVHDVRDSGCDLGHFVIEWEDEYRRVNSGRQAWVEWDCGEQI